MEVKSTAIKFSYRLNEEILNKNVRKSLKEFLSEPHDTGLIIIIRPEVRTVE